MVKKAKVDYDHEYDILYVYTGEKVRDSIGIDNFVIDFSPGDTIVGLEVLDASKILSDLLEIKITKDMLLNINKAGFGIHKGREIAYIKLFLSLMMKNQEKELRIPIPTAPFG